ncbi:tetratricopeptide repeat protein [Amphibacillus indicireducens]|uniref:Tetratricopeptide repeat protein n=1 Tax=Amphibacillus indicireducens TaxID=1076330 RepID=A0ABP7VQL9_9BACI
MNPIDQAIQLIEQDEIKKAVSILRDYVRQASDNDLITIADLFIELGLLDDARSILESLLEDYPDESDIRLVLAEIYIDLENDEQALNHLEAIDQSSDEYIASLMVAADLYQTQGLFEVAEQKLIEAKQLAPNEVLINFAQAELAFSLGKYDDALFNYRKIHQQNDQIAEVDLTLRIAESLAAIGEFEEALDYYQDVEIDDPEILFRYGFIAYQANRMDIAIHTWEELLKQDPEYGSVYNFLAEAYQEEGLIDQGYQATQKGLEIDPLNKELLLTAASLARKVGQNDESYRLARKAISIDPGYKAGILFLIENYRKEDDFEAIIDLLTHIIEQGEEDGYYKWELAKAYEAEETYDLALKYYQDAYNDFKDDSDFLKAYGYFLVEEGMREEAVQIFTRYLSIDPSDVEIESYLARLKD